MSAHRSGPWKWYWRTNDAGNADCGVYTKEPPGHVYAVARCPKYVGQEEWEANATLIAAAPDLLEALQETVLQIEYLHGKFSGTGSGETVLAKARAAIAKATQ